jgi:16S rRNA (cytosine967-C5)-methyltransferase
MKQSGRIQTVIDILEVCLSRRNRPADDLVSEALRARRYIGSKDRKAINEYLWGVFRNFQKLEWIIGKEEPTARDFVIAYLSLVRGEDVAEFFDGEKYSPEKLTAQEIEMMNKSFNDAPAHIMLETPNWLYEKLLPVYGDGIKEELLALNEPAKTDLRVFASKTTRDDFAKILDKKNITYSKTPYSPFGIRLEGRVNLHELPADLFEVQDEGSQLISILCEPKKSHKICDYCAGAMGKTLSLSDLTNGKAEITACDVSKNKLTNGLKRIKKSRFKAISCVLVDYEGQNAVEDYEENFNVVLVDAPCSGTGTFRRSPDAKNRITPDFIEEIKTAQKSVLKTGSKIVKKGGRLVYATCSLLKEENEDQIEEFLQNNPDFELLDAREIWKNQIGTDAPFSGKMMRLSPHKTQTDGFFTAVLKKI